MRATTIAIGQDPSPLSMGVILLNQLGLNTDYNFYYDDQSAMTVGDTTPSPEGGSVASGV